MKNMLSILLLAAVLCGSSSCKKEHRGCKEEVTGIVRDYTGKLDGCAMMIELSNGGRLEVRSVPSGVTLVDGKKVAIKYTVNTQAASICMAGDIADITHLRYL
jgi:hypothetical protein